MLKQFKVKQWKLSLVTTPIQIVLFFFFQEEQLEIVLETTIKYCCRVK